MEELLKLYQKYCSKEYSIGDVSRILSYIDVPDNISHEVEDVEYKVECIRFLCSDDEQFEKVKDILSQLIVQMKEYN